MIARLITAVVPFLLGINLLTVHVVAAEPEPFTIFGWGKIVDPDGDCAVVIQKDSISIQVPAGAHDLSAELNKVNAPRIVQDIPGDFVLEIRVDGDFVAGEATIAGRTAYNGAGLLLWQDDRNFIRLERAALKRAGKVSHYVNFEQRLDGKIQFFGAPVDFQVDETQACFLRLERKGQQVLGSARQGDEPWTALIPNSAPLPLTVKVGIAAVNASNAPFAPRFSDRQLQTGPQRSASTEPGDEPDPYAVPDSGIEDLVAFIQRIKAMRPRTRTAMMSHRLKSAKALALAAERILELEDVPIESRQIAQQIVLEQKVGSATRLDESEQRALLDELKAYCDSSNDFDENGQLMFAFGRGIEYAKRTELASEAYTAASKILSKSESEEMLKLSEKVAGAARRVNLVGNQMEVRGKQADGEDFDLATYEGKVVLIDFWATWCGPCVAELPNLKKNYELYHDKGFEVVGVCLDTSREKLESFVESKEIPWVNLFEEGAAWDHSVANQYGIMAIPTVILINAEGKVISLKARGAELGRLLEEELGPIDADRLQENEEKRNDELSPSQTEQ